MAIASAGRGQRCLRLSGIAGRLLGGRHGGVGGEIHEMALVFFALEVRMLVELPEKGARVQVQALAQLSGGEAGGGLTHQGHDGLRQMAVPREADVPVKPQTVGVEVGHFGQGIKAAVVVEAGQGLPLSEAAADRANGGLEGLAQLGQGDHLLAAPATQDVRGGIANGFHGRGQGLANGILYVYSLNTTYTMPFGASENQRKANEIAGS